MTDCTCAKQTVWVEDQFTVTSSAGIWNHEKRVVDIVVRELKRTKLVSGDAYRLTKCGQLRRRLTCGLDTLDLQVWDGSW